MSSLEGSLPTARQPGRRGRSLGPISLPPSSSSSTVEVRQTSSGSTTKDETGSRSRGRSTTPEGDDSNSSSNCNTASQACPSSSSSSRRRARSNRRRGSTSTSVAAHNVFSDGCLYQLFEQQLLTDIELQCGAEVVGAHKLVVAHASPMLHEKLAGGKTRLVLHVEEPTQSGVHERRESDAEEGTPSRIFDDVLRYLYTGRVEFTPRNAIPLLAGADRYQMKGLKRLSARYIAESIERDNAPSMLRRALRFDVGEIVDRCVSVIGKNFCWIFDQDYSFVPPDLFLRIVQQGDLAVTDEYEDVYVPIMRYVQQITVSASGSSSPSLLSLSPSPSPSSSSSSPPTFACALSTADTVTAVAQERPQELLMAIFSCVRYRWLSHEQLLQAAINPLVPRCLLVEALLLKSLCPAPSLPTNNGTTSLSEVHEKDLDAMDMSEIPASARSCVSYRREPRKSPSISFEPPKDIGVMFRGVVHWLATRGGRHCWENPHDSGVVQVTCSSIEKGNASQLVESKSGELLTKSVPASWLLLDLGPTRRVRVSHYTLRHGGPYRADSLRTWDFQGSMDGVLWNVLRRHTNDTSLNGPFAVHSWSVLENSDQEYRYLRILQRGQNSSNHNFLLVSGLELYGVLLLV